MNSKKLRVGFVGLGWWGNELAQAAATLRKEIEIFSCTSLSQEEMDKFTGHFGCQQFSSYRELITTPDLDAVVLSTPHSLHANQIVQAAMSKKHVFVEKPLALNTLDATRAIKVCRDQEVVLAVGHNRRFSGAAQELARWIKKGRLGQPLHIDAHFSSNSAMDFKPDNWRADKRESPAGSLVSIGLHMIDTIQWLLGPIERLSCISKHQALPVRLQDTTTALFELKNGMTGTLGTLFATPLTSSLRIYGTCGMAEAKNDFTTLTWTIDPGQIEEKHFSSIEDTLVSEMSAFEAACNQYIEYPVGAEEAVLNVAIIEAMSCSAGNKGQWVDVSNILNRADHIASEVI